MKFLCVLGTTHEEVGRLRMFWASSGIFYESWDLNTTNVMSWEGIVDVLEFVTLAQSPTIENPDLGNSPVGYRLNEPVLTVSPFGQV